MKKILTFFTVVLTLTTQQTFAQDEVSFRQSKIEMVKIFKQLDSPKTIYCGCDIKFVNKGYMPDLESCGYQIRKNEKRAKRIEAEHIMSAWEFGHKDSCWRNGGRKNCAVNDENFIKLESDLHNLYPAVGEVNADRSNYQFSERLRVSPRYGKCQMQIDSARQRVVAPDRAKGIVARAYLYMSDKYNIKLDAEHINLFNQWNRAYRADKNECIRNLLIKKVQGNDNPFVTAQCKKYNQIDLSKNENN